MSKRRTKRRVIALAFITVCVIAACVFSRFGGFGTGPSADVDEFSRYAQPVSEITIPEGTQIVALGEATHGNKEFQELKLEVLQVLAQRHNVRAFALEADAGGCELVNRYIHGGAGTLDEALQNLDFTLYRTNQMAELISWMRTYNETAAPGDDLRFYGFDLQNYEHSHQLLLEEMRARGLDTAGLESLGELRATSDGADHDLIQTTYTSARQQLEALGSDQDTACALHLTDCLLANSELSAAIDSAEGPAMRDRFMAQNVLWVASQEEQRGNQPILISGHNGHIEQQGSYGPDAKVMGNLLADELDDAYYAIGTDFFEAEVSLPRGNGRMTHTFYSHDPLAKAAALAGLEVCWLDFAKVPSASPLTPFIAEPIMMGSVGEGFSPLMYVLPQTYRIKRAPRDPYDSMIFVAHAHPTEQAAQ
ncbi:MAG: erythromycin esterase family protein [Coriobacteriales bacterium]|nr:erythromycin esterase family protein [Coriobacteriales bacterium]